MTKSLSIIANALPAIALATAGTAFAQDKLEKVDSILDRLEQRLLDEQSDGLTFGEKLPPLETDPPDATYKFESKGKIQGKTNEQEGLRELGNLITDLENQVDQLASNVQKTKQSLVDESGIDNFVALEAHLDDTDAAAIRSLKIKLDGYDVYELKETSGLWMPAKLLPLYSGPLQPGHHRIDLEARIVMKTGKTLPLNGDVYRFVNKSFELTVPGGTSTARYVIAIKPPEKLDGTADAVMKEAL